MNCGLPWSERIFTWTRTSSTASFWNTCVQRTGLSCIAMQLSLSDVLARVEENQTVRVLADNTGVEGEWNSLMVVSCELEFLAEKQVGWAAWLFEPFLFHELYSTAVTMLCAVFKMFPSHFRLKRLLFSVFSCVGFLKSYVNVHDKPPVLHPEVTRPALSL